MSAVIGSKWALSNDVKGKSFRRKINASKEKSCQKEETLTTRERESRRKFSASRRTTSRGFLFVHYCVARRIVLETPMGFLSGQSAQLEFA
jgi:hypothetical protein